MATKLNQIIDKYVRIQKSGYETVTITQVLQDLWYLRPAPRENVEGGKE